MTNRHFSPRAISLHAAVLAILLVNYACATSLSAPIEGTVEPAESSPGEPAPPAEEQPAAAPEEPVLTFVAPTQSVSVPEASPTQTLPSPVIPETRRLTLEYPPKMKAGAESDVIRLTLEVDELGNITPTVQVEGNIITGEVIQIPSLYETHFVTAEARIDMAGMDIQPPGAIYEPMTAGQSVKFFWSIRPPDTGLYRGTVWLHLMFVDRLSGEESRMAVSAQVIEIEAVDFFGFSVNVARTSGVVGSIVGGIVGFPFLEDIVKFLFRRRKKN